MDRLFYPVKQQNHACAGSLDARRFSGLAGPRRRCGFTLVELVVTMIVIGILAVTVLPRFSLLKGYDEVGYRDKVKATLEFARKTAVAQRRHTCATLGSNGLKLTVDLNIPESYAGGCPANLLLLPSRDTKYCGSAASGNEICAPSGVTLAGTATLIFSPLGRPAAGASYTVKGDSTTTITVEAETGYVH